MCMTLPRLWEETIKCQFDTIPVQIAKADWLHCRRFKTDRLISWGVHEREECLCKLLLYNKLLKVMFRFKIWRPNVHSFSMLIRLYNTIANRPSPWCKTANLFWQSRAEKLRLHSKIQHDYKNPLLENNSSLSPVSHLSHWVLCSHQPLDVFL